MSVHVNVNTQKLQSFIQKDKATAPQVLAEWQQGGSQELLMQLRNNTPYKYGNLREAANKRFTPKGFTIFFTAGKYSSIAGFLEKGTKPHMIFPSNPAGVLSWTDKSGIQRFAKHVKHPGFSGRFFVQKTRDQARPVLRELYRQIWEKWHR